MDCGTCRLEGKWNCIVDQLQFRDLLAISRTKQRQLPDGLNLLVIPLIAELLNYDVNIKGIQFTFKGSDSGISLWN
jgi:hypothetical protein